MPFARYFCIFINVGLGEAAKRNVGTGENQIPDMSAFPSGKNWFQLPSGHIVQMFSMNVYGADTNGTGMISVLHFLQAHWLLVPYGQMAH
ncbi:hypothetical protein TUM9754_35360 [Escherichia coli]|nr:hypothetical protein TUM9754_35360 [Escherichia coli]